MTESEIEWPTARSSGRELDRVTESEIELLRLSPMAFHMSGPGVGARGTHTLCCGVHTVLCVLFVGGWTRTTLICWRGFSLSLQSVQCVDSWPPRGARAAGMSGTVLGVCVCVCVCVRACMYVHVCMCLFVTVRM